MSTADGKALLTDELDEQNDSPVHFSPPRGAVTPRGVPSASPPGSPAFPLTLNKFVLLNSVVAGLELAASAGFTYIPPMLLKAGFEEQHMSWIIGTGPFICLVIVPLLGSWSDRCRSRYGRRIPFIFALCLVTVAGLILIPYSDHVVSGGSLSKADESMNAWRRFAAFGLALGVILLDLGTQACMTPCETLLSDVTEGTNTRERAFTVYSVMCSGGACMGYLITAINWETTPVGLVCGDQENSVFALLFGLFILSVVTTLKTALDARNAGVGTRGAHMLAGDSAPLLGVAVGAPASSLADADAQALKGSAMSGANGSAMGHHLSNGGKLTSSHTAKSHVSDESSTCGRWLCCRLCCGGSAGVGGLGSGPSRFLTRRFVLGLVAFLPYRVREVLRVPLVLRRLMLACFFAWAGVMCFVIFFTEYVGEVVYNGSPNSLPGSVDRELYENGLRVGSLGLLLHSVVSSASAYCIERIGGMVGLRPVFVGCMVGFSVVTFALVFVENTPLVILLAMATGVAFAALTTIPFTLMGLYHEDKQVYFMDVSPDTQHCRGMGSDMGLLDTTYFSSQVLLMAFMGSLVQAMHTAKAYMLTASAMATLSCYFSAQVIYNKKDAMEALGPPPLAPVEEGK